MVTPCATSTLPNNRRVLVIDDEPSVLRAYQRTMRPLVDADLAGGPFELCCQASPEAGIEALREALEAGRPFALAFVDQCFPGPMDGLEGAARMLELDPNLEVVMVTAAHLTDAATADVKMPPRERFLVLKKPLEAAELRACARSLTHKWTLRRAAQVKLACLDAKLAERVLELEQANQELRAERAARECAQTELLRAQKLEAVGRLASGIAHEINTPAQFVADNLSFARQGVSRLIEMLHAHREIGGPQADKELAKLRRKLKLDYLERELPASLTQAVEGIERVGGLVRAMKEFAHPGQSSKAMTDLSACVSSTAIVARGSYKGVAELELDLAPNAMVMAVAAELNQAILVLIVNAAQAITEVVGPEPERKGRILVSTSCHEHVVRVVVEDSGPGVDEAIEDRIFDPFFTTREVGCGSGQGLAIAHNIVTQRHAGRLYVERTDAGARFVLELPRREVAA
ncbi:MAG: hypothetical protein GXP55_11935 [Deltaproteobacteria bacterium]|nr:hypothetical protein [Deltaproteobacteria bacterium]